jgi:membrane protein implicated in regulation of membrane protease activity
MDNETWRWVWVIATLVLGFGEIVTAGFFMLPFAVGALVATILAWLDVAPLVQLLTFLAVSLAALFVMQRFVKKMNKDIPRMGSNRMLGQRGKVTEIIDPQSGSGRVRVETEDWRATTDGDDLEVGAAVRVTGIRGTRLVVEKVD